MRKVLHCTHAYNTLELIKGEERNDRLSQDS